MKMASLTFEVSSYSHTMYSCGFMRRMGEVFGVCINVGRWLFSVSWKVSL